ncbi:uncharacterized protein EI90DRAFT_3053657, partial [Cantharellus anzutake]|uniref:uncharacterized protein n=1 Tax=Cantharellus anzutake TaxID=1750568 RepID=UPI001904A07F
MCEWPIEGASVMSCREWMLEESLNAQLHWWDRSLGGSPASIGIDGILRHDVSACWPW